MSFDLNPFYIVLNNNGAVRMEFNGVDEGYTSILIPSEYLDYVIEKLSEEREELRKMNERRDNLAAIRADLANGRKIDAIKKIRVLYGLGLRDAKELVVDIFGAQ